MLEISGLRAGYGAVEILRNVDLLVRRGETVALLGANGAGKSTLSNAICGVVPASAGRIRFDGADITASQPRNIVARGVIQVCEGRRIFPNLTVDENLSLGSYRRGRERRAANAERVYTLFPRLRERIRQLAGTLSGGEQQMLAIGRALMGEPRLLILDEPSLGLSPRLVEEMFALIGQLHTDEIGILLVEQNVVQSLAVADRAYVLENGAIAMSGTPAELIGDAAVKRAYLGF